MRDFVAIARAHGSRFEWRMVAAICLAMALEAIAQPSVRQS